MCQALGAAPKTLVVQATPQGVVLGLCGRWKEGRLATRPFEPSPTSPTTHHPVHAANSFDEKKKKSLGAGRSRAHTHTNPQTGALLLLPHFQPSLEGLRSLWKQGQGQWAPAGPPKAVCLQASLVGGPLRPGKMQASETDMEAPHLPPPACVPVPLCPCPPVTRWNRSWLWRNWWRW